MNPSSLFDVQGLTGLTLLAFAGVLLFILVISFRSRAIVFCQYLKAMTGVELKPKQVRAVFKDRGQDGVREMFLDLIIKEDLRQTGPLQIPPELRAGKSGKPKSQG
ncbi:MAG: hypothetical protein NEA02_15830 [Thermoanaerobaculia bacterium]|nr:hypothetical protein [Thermoanaerobaculia bacterium]